MQMGVIPDAHRLELSSIRHDHLRQQRSQLLDTQKANFCWRTEANSFVPVVTRRETYKSSQMPAAGTINGLSLQVMLYNGSNIRFSAICPLSHDASSLVGRIHLLCVSR